MYGIEVADLDERGAGATVSQSLDYGFGSGLWSTTSSAGAYASYGMLTAGGNVSYTHGASGGWNWGVSAGIGSGNDQYGVGLSVGYGSGGWSFGVGGYYDPYYQPPGKSSTTSRRGGVQSVGDPPSKQQVKEYLAGEFLDGRISRKEYLNAIALVDDGPWGLFKNVVSNNKYDIAMTVVPVGRLGMLGRYFASLEHLSQPGKIIIKNLRSGPRLAKQYGGNASDWVKMTSTTYNGSGGFKFSTHWYQNVSTGARVEYKTVFGR